MTLLEQIEKQVSALPADKQSEVLNFILFLQQQTKISKPAASSLKSHAAFGSWQARNVNALEYEENLRSEWER